MSAPAADLARRVESARARLDGLLSAKYEEPAAEEVVSILRSEDLIGADETELSGALWVILTTLKEQIDELITLQDVAGAEGPAEQLRLLREAEKSADIERAQLLITLADRWAAIDKGARP